MKLKDAINVFLSTYSNAKTRLTYEYSLMKMADYIGNRPVQDISPLDAMAYVGSLISHTTAKGKPLSPHSINKEIKTCRAFYNWLVRIESIPKSPFVGVRYQPVPLYDTHQKSMPDDDLLLILERVKYMPRENALIRFLADTGCRARGVGELTLDRLDIPNRIAWVIEKGDKSRPVVFGEDTANALTRWLQKRGNLASPLVFQSTDKRTFSAEAVGAMVRRCCILAGVKPRQSHALRHRKGEQIMATYADPAKGSKALGNSVKTFLASYASRDINDALEMMRDLVLESEKQTPPNVIQLPPKKDAS